MKTNPQATDSNGGLPPQIMEAAALWVLRLDRGLSAVEQDDYSQWLATDPRHREALAMHRWGWEELDRLAGLQTSLNAVPDPNLLAPTPGPWGKISRAITNHDPLRLHPALLSLAAVLILGAFVWIGTAFVTGTNQPDLAVAPSQPKVNPLSALIKQRNLPDGSLVELNRGAIVETQFTPTERRVRLVRGEANFIVAKNPARPFIVSAGGVEVQAVGTVFNVRLNEGAVEVLVSEGKVALAKVSPTQDPTPERIELPSIVAGQATVVSREPTAAVPEVTTLTQEEMEQKLAWQPRTLDFTDEPLSAIVAEFNRRNPVRLTIDDPTLAKLRLSATFRSDNMEGFIRLMEADFGMDATWQGETRVTLRRASTR